MLKPSLQLKLGQQLTMTPQLQQAIRLLQLPALELQAHIRELTSRDIGVLITDHNVRETLGVCNRAYIVNQGTVIAAGSAEEILANPQVREVYLGQSFRL